MIRIFRKFFLFSGDQKGNFYSSIWISLIHAIFEALRIPAIALVITAIIEDNMSGRTALYALLLILVSILGCMLSRRSMTMKQTIAGYTLGADKRVEIGERLKYMPMGYFNNNSLGYITSVATNTTENLQDVATRVVQLVMQGVLTTAVIAVALFFYDWRIGLIIAAGILLFLAANQMVQKRSVKLTPRKTEADSRLVGAVLEYIQGISVVKSFNLDQQANKTMDDAIRENEKATYQMEKTFVPLIALQSVVLKLSGVAMVLVSISFYLSGSMELINCLLMMVSSFIIFAQLDAAGSYSSLLRIVDESINKIEDIFNTPVMDIDGKDQKPRNFDIRGEHISFSYEEQKILDDISFSIPEGSTTAVVGPSGSGKTTLCHLIARFWDVDEGKITIGGTDVREYTLDSLLANISMVFQNVYLFNDTIANNIKFGKPSATMEEVIEAAKKACCHDFIMELPDGYDTMVGEMGGTISGGEKQRISIARALLKDAPIIILDEATANVDPENEKLLQEAIGVLTRDKTIIMIAHRLKTIRNADQILVVDGGKIAERGTHEELLKKKGIYCDLVSVRKRAIGWKLGEVKNS